MSDLIISRRITNAAGEPIDADTPPVLRDPTDAFGMRDNASGAIIVAAGTELTRASAGVYTLTVSGLIPGRAYTYWIEAVVNGATSRREKTHTAPTAGDVIAYESAKRYLALDHDEFEAEIRETLAEIIDELKLATREDVETGTVRPVVRRLIKEMLAHKLRYKGDEAGDYPESIKRVIRMITPVSL